jgi:hypothetical protein
MSRRASYGGVGDNCLIFIDAKTFLQHWSTASFRRSQCDAVLHLAITANTPTAPKADSNSKDIPHDAPATR